MGTLRSNTTEPQGHLVNGVLLGEPVELDGNPLTYEWDDSAFPNGSVTVQDNELVLTVDSE